MHHSKTAVITGSTSAIGSALCRLLLAQDYAIAHIVQPNKQHVHQAFTAFTNFRRKKTSAIINSGRQLAACLFNPEPVFCAQRNLTSQQTDYAKMASGMAQHWAKGLPRKSELIV